jgi:hypothetical protein
MVGNKGKTRMETLASKQEWKKPRQCPALILSPPKPDNRQKDNAYRINAVHDTNILQKSQEKFIIVKRLGRFNQPLFHELLSGLPI